MSLLCEHSAPFLGTWPASGMTRTGAASELPMWEPPTPGSGSSSSPGPDLLPTPEAKLANSGPDYARADREGSGGDDLVTTVARQSWPNLPTPVANDWRGANAQRAQDDGRQTTLADVFTPGHLLPTPMTTDAKLAGPADANRHDPGLRAVDSLLPTPSVADGLGGHLSRSGERGEEMLLPGIAKAASTGGLLPTPTATERGRTPEQAEQRIHGQATLQGGPDLSSVAALLPGTLGRMARHEVLLPTPNPFHLTNSEDPDEWLERRKEVQERTGTRHAPALPVVAKSVTEGRPLYQGGQGPTRWSPGDPTSPPSDDGSEDWDE